MPRTGTATLPLHPGRCPPWLFGHMTKLARAISETIIHEFGRGEFLKKLADPFFFQSLGCALAFDYHSSGLTTTVCGAIKEALKGTEHELGIFVAGGKGKTSRKTPQEIEFFGQKYSFNSQPLVYASKISAKVDNNALQDGYQLYHHNFFFSQEGEWSVIQQGMNTENHLARRYHWFSKNIISFVQEPHSAICSHRRGREVLDLVAKKSVKNQAVTAKISQEKPEKLVKTLTKLQENPSQNTSVSIRQEDHLFMPQRHLISLKDLNPKRLERTFLKAYQQKAENFEQLLGTSGVGPKTIRALSLIAELVWGAKPSYQDPARYAFAHGGKDGTPYPVNRKTYHASTMILHDAIKKAKIGEREKIRAIKRLRLL